MNSICNYARVRKLVFFGTVVGCLLFITSTKYVKLIRNEDQSLKSTFMLHAPNIDASLEELNVSTYTQVNGNAQIKTFNKFKLIKKISNLYFRHGKASFNYSRAYIDQLINFSTVMASLGVKICILEPVILYSLLSKEHQQLLSKRNFSIEEYLETENVLSFGLFKDDVEQFEKGEFMTKLRNLGYKPFIYQEPLPFWMWQKSKQKRKLEHITSHILLEHQKWKIHVAFFYERANYLWISALKFPNNTGFMKTDKLLFAANDAAFEKFTLVPVAFSSSSLPKINIPSDMEYFLFQLPMSKFLECDLRRAVNITKFVEKPHYSQFSFEEFNQRTVIALKELKKTLNPLLMHFWIWSGTMLGWYRQCDIIPYTTDVDFGAWAKEVDDVNELKSLFIGNKDLKIIERLGMVDRALEFHLETRRLRVDLFFLYQETNGTWYGGHRSGRGYYFKYHHPHFTLCSGELLGEKVQVPCESEKCIIKEYGQSWKMPVTEWWYDSSIKNKGPNIYWEKSMLPKVHEQY